MTSITTQKLVPVYGVVEVGAGADFSLRFNGDGDHIEIPHDDGLNISNSLYISAMIHPYTTDGIQFITMKGDYGWGMYLNGGQIGYASDTVLQSTPFPTTQFLPTHGRTLKLI